MTGYPPNERVSTSSGEMGRHYDCLRASSPSERRCELRFRHIGVTPGGHGCQTAAHGPEGLILTVVLARSSVLSFTNPGVIASADVT
jgi:hypothetical protein